MTGSKCCVPRCNRRPALVTLYGVDAGFGTGGPLHFCSQCAPWYEAKGYRRQPFPKAGSPNDRSRVA